MMASQIPTSLYRGPPVAPQPKGAPAAKAAPPKAAPKPAAPKAAPPKGAPAKAAQPQGADKHKPGTRPGVPQPEKGHPPLHRIPIVDHKGNMRGHVGHSATQATVARFLGRHGAKLGTHEGRPAWIGDKPPPPPPPDFLMGPNGPAINPHGRGTDKPPFPPGPDKAKGEAEVGLINARRDSLLSKAASDAKAAKSKPKK